MCVIRAPSPACVSRRVLVRAGFTIHELVVTLAVVAVLAALALPRWGSAISRQRVEAAARRIGVDLRLARTHARAASTTIEVLFDPPSGAYSIPALTDPATRKSGYVVELARPPYEVQITKAMFGTIPVARFNSFGVPVAAGSVVVERGTHVRTIEVAGETGEIAIR
jgi:prepilin-type N-terminal cleavage/methylation domain-containing protein